MVGHENPGMNMNLVLTGVLLQPVRIGSKILIRTKANLAIVATLNDVLRDARKAYSG